MQERKIIMGIDPGYGRMGYAFIQVEGADVKLLECGVLTTIAKSEFALRLTQLGDDILELIGLHKPDLVTIEKLFFGKSRTTAMQVAEVRGMITYLVAQKGIPIREFSPSQIKKALTGDGTADKKAVQEMVKRLLHLPRVPKPDDAADAVAVALTGSTNVPF